METLEPEDFDEKVFGLKITKITDKKTNLSQFRMQTNGNLNMAEAVVNVEQWVKRVKEEYYKNVKDMKFK